MVKKKYTEQEREQVNARRAKLAAVAKDMEESRAVFTGNVWQEIGWSGSPS